MSCLGIIPDSSIHSWSPGPWDHCIRHKNKKVEAMWRKKKCSRTTILFPRKELQRHSSILPRPFSSGTPRKVEKSTYWGPFLGFPRGKCQHTLMKACKSAPPPPFETTNVSLACSSSLLDLYSEDGTQHGTSV